MAGPRKPRGRRGQGAENGRARLPPHTPTPTPMATALPPTHTGPRRPRQGHCLGPPDPWGATEAVKQGGQHTTPRGEGPCQCRPQARARVQGWGGGSVEAAGPTGWPSLPPSGMGRPVSTDACGAEPGRLVPCPSAPGFSARAAAGLWHSSLAPALAGVPGQRPEGDRPEPQARHRRRGKNRPALSPTPKAALDPAVAEPEPGGLLE